MKRVFIVAGIIVLTVILKGLTYGDGDWQYWNTESIKVNLKENVGVYVEEEFRFGDGISKFYYQHSQIQLNFKINNWFTLAQAYRQIFELYTKSGTDDDWFTEYRAMLNGTIKWKWRDFKFKDRVRVAYRMFDIKKDEVWRFRNKLTIQTPWKWTSLNINPWIAEEIFLEEKKGIYRNRFYMGIKLKLMKHLEGDIFYFWQTTEKGNHWIDYNIFGTKIKVVF